MKFSTRTDIAAPQQAVFAAAADFPGFERQALRRGVEIERRQEAVAPGDAPGAGTAWRLAVPFRGRSREIEAAVTGFAPPEGYRIAGAGDGLEMEVSVELMALARDRTRLFVALELKPRTLAARLMVQSMKLAKSTLTRRFEARVAEFGAGLERR